MAVEEGPASLWKGLFAGLQRQVVFAGIRIGLYQPVRDMVVGELPPGRDPPLYKKIAAGLITGFIGISVANPTDVIKIRMQAQGRDPNVPKIYENTIDCYRKTVQK